MEAPPRPWHRVIRAWRSLPSPWPLPEPTDGCAYSRVTAKGLEFQLQSTHYAALATIDYDYRSVTSIRYKSGGDASSRLTPLSVTNTARVLTDKIGQPIDEFYLAGTCNQEGLCTVTGCEAYVFWLCHGAQYSTPGQQDPQKSDDRAVVDG
jgi:hypothetical protein